jgi:hypothetical protein
VKEKGSWLTRTWSSIEMSGGGGTRRRWNMRRGRRKSNSGGEKRRGKRKGFVREKDRRLEKNDVIVVDEADGVVEALVPDTHCTSRSATNT